VKAGWLLRLVAMQFSEELALNLPTFWSSRPEERTGLIYDN